MKEFVSVILPCRNEERTIAECIRKVKQVFNSQDIDGEIIVSDSSVDGSAEIAKRLGIKVVKHNKEGYGRAFFEALKYAKGEIIVMGDADNTYDFLELPKLLSKIKNNDLVLGSRLKGKINKGAMPWLHQYVGNPAISLIMRAFFKSKVSDTQSGFRVIRKEALTKMDLNTVGMEFATEMIIQATKLKLRVAEVPITYSARANGSQSKLRSFRDGWKHLRFMILYSDASVFLIPGFSFILAGILILILYGISSISYLGLFLTVLGYRIILFGVFLKIYSTVHLKTKSNMVDLINRYISIEKAIFISLFFFIFSAFALYYKRDAVLFVTIVLLGVQSLFDAFLLSIIGIEKK